MHVIIIFIYCCFSFSELSAVVFQSHTSAAFSLLFKVFFFNRKAELEILPTAQVKPADKMSINVFLRNASRINFIYDFVGFVHKGAMNRSLNSFLSRTGFNKYISSQVLQVRSGLRIGTTVLSIASHRRLLLSSFSCRSIIILFIYLYVQIGLRIFLLCGNVGPRCFLQRMQDIFHCLVSGLCPHPMTCPSAVCSSSTRAVHAHI